MVETSRIISTNVESVIKDYSIKRAIYKDFASRLEDLVRDFMDKAGIEIHLVESRAKQRVLRALGRKFSSQVRPMLIPSRTCPIWLALG